MTVLTRIRILAALASLLLASGASALSNGMSQARAAGMGMAYTALARGINAPAWNPANLARDDAPSLDIGLFGVAIQPGNDGVSYGDFVDWTADEVLTTAELQEALDMFPGDALSIHANAEAAGLPFSIVVGKFAFTYRVVFMADVGVPRGLADMLSDSRSHSEQYQLATSATGLVRDMSGLTADAWALGTAGFSYARLIDVPALDRFAVGATLNIYFASPRFRVLEAEGDLIVRGNTFESENMRFKTQIAGGVFNRVEEIEWVDGAPDTTTKFESDFNTAAAWGLGLTLGANGTWNGVWDFGLAVHNIPLRPITWTTGETRTYEIHTSGRTITAKTLFTDKPDELDTVDYLDTLFAAPGGSTEQYERHSSVTGYAPIYIRAGVARDFVGDMITWAFDWEQGFTKSAVSSTTPRIATGAEFRPLGRVFPLRAGMSIGGRTGHYATLGFGLNLGPFAWDVAMVNEGAFTPFEVPFASRSRGVGFSTQMRLIF